MSDRPRLLLDCVLRAMRPLVRLLIRHGVTYPAFAAALKRVFLQAAQAELQASGRATTDSALTLLSGVHRRDVRTLMRGADALAEPESHAPLSQAAEVNARWRSDPAWLDGNGEPRVLDRAAFDTLVASISSDVRPRAMLDELLRLGAVEEAADGLRLSRKGFAPRSGLKEAAWIVADNLHDHAKAAAMNLDGRSNFLEQAIFVDELLPRSTAQLQAVAVQAWQQAFKTVMHEAQARFDADAQQPKAERTHRARFGVYFFSEPENEP